MRSDDAAPRGTRAFLQRIMGYRRAMPFLWLENESQMLEYPVEEGWGQWRLVRDVLDRGIAVTPRAEGNCPTDLPNHLMPPCVDTQCGPFPAET
mmetsp:Transcript_48313/g.79575  ORF Transcript_48313/g.79575 Transcript_48313/m.79575 type:complete len:94 (-) Transcript_48313:598-879(-)